MVETHAAVLAIFIPAESAVRNWLRGQILKTPQQNIVFRNLDFPAQNGDANEARKWAKEGGWSGHASLILGTL